MVLRALIVHIDAWICYCLKVVEILCLYSFDYYSVLLYVPAICESHYRGLDLLFCKGRNVREMLDASNIIG